MSPSAVHNSLIPIKKTVRTLHFRYCFEQLQQLHIALFADHRLRFFAEWVVDVILLQVGMKCFSMRMIFDLLCKLLNSEMFCFFHNCMWQSWYSEVNFVLLFLIHEYGSPSTCLIIFNMFRCQHATFCGFVSTYGSPRTCWVCDFIMFLLLRVSRSNLVRFSISFVDSLLDEDGFRSSSRVRELGDVLLLLQLRVTVLVP